MPASDRQHVATFVLEGLLVVLAFVGIVLFLKFYGTAWLVPAGIVWGIIFLADLVVVIRRVSRARAARTTHASRHRPAG